MGSCFVEGKRYKIDFFTKLDDLQKAELNKMPLGLLLSNVKKNDNLDSIEVLDAGSVSCIITYGDGKTDSKIADNKIIGALNELMKKVFTKKLACHK